MNIITSIDEMQRAAESLRGEGKRLGVVPTMGYLHDGHVSLIRLARERSDVVVTTIFVNPLQFGPKEDFGRYPRDMDRDVKITAGAGTDILFTPSGEDVYPEHYRTKVCVENLSSLLEGKFRPTHFDGVTTVVTKLFHITKPHLAFFGQKDIQQVVILKKMVNDLNFDIEIIVGPTIRERDGLAMSSRNVYLTESERKQSTVLYRSLQLAAERVQAGERNADAIINEMTRLISAQPAARIDYIAFTDSSALQEIKLLHPSSEVILSLAVRFGSTRLIDNFLITIP